MAAKVKKEKEQYLKVPYHILNLRGLGLCQKMLLSHIYSFGAKGCWQSNATLGEIFMVSERTVTTWVGQLKSSRLILLKCPKGYSRTLYAAAHPDVRAAKELWYRNRKVAKDAGRDSNCGHGISGEGGKKPPVGVEESASQGGRKRRGKVEETSERSTQEHVVSPRRNLPPINNHTKKETTGATTAPPSPLPARGQAPAVLAERDAAQREQVARFVERFKMRFGRLPRAVRGCEAI